MHVGPSWTLCIVLYFKSTKVNWASLLQHTIQTQTTHPTSSTNNLSWLLPFEDELAAAIAISCNPHKLCIWNLHFFYKKKTLCLTQSFGTSGTSGARIWHQSVWTWTWTMSWAKTQVAGLANNIGMWHMQLKWSSLSFVDSPTAWQNIFRSEWMIDELKSWPQKTNLALIQWIVRRKWISPDLAWHMWHLLTNHHLCDNLSLKKIQRAKPLDEVVWKLSVSHPFALLLPVGMLTNKAIPKHIYCTHIASNICQKSLSAFIFSSFRFSFFPIIIFKIMLHRLWAADVAHIHTSQI